MTDTTPGRKVSAPLVVAVVAAVLAIFLAIAARPSTGEAQPAAGAPAASGTGQAAAGPDMARREEGDPLALGEVSAPVVLVNYSEFQCPFCGKFARDTKPELQKYVDDGTLRIEWRDFPYLGQESMTAAAAGRAAAAQGRFWEFHDEMFADQQPPNSGRVTEAYLTAVADRAGLDTAKFRAALTDQTLQEGVRADFEEGTSIGVTGTPAFLVNGQPIIGAQPTQVFVEAIEKAAAAAQ